MPRIEASCCSSSPKACPLIRELMREERREEEQGREMQGKLPAWKIVTRINLRSRRNEEEGVMVA